jgi:hypothetical protein
MWESSYGITSVFEFETIENTAVGLIRDERSLIGSRKLRGGRN